MKRFTIPRVAHCSDGCRSQSWARLKTANTRGTPGSRPGVPARRIGAGSSSLRARATSAQEGASPWGYEHPAATGRSFPFRVFLRPPIRSIDST